MRCIRLTVGLAAVGLGLAGCSLDSLLNSDKLPKGVSDPAVTQTPEGARSAYNGTLIAFRQTFAGSNPRSFVAAAGLLSDELMVSNGENTLDRRTLPEGTVDPADDAYSSLQKIRGQATQAIGLLTQYVPDQPELVAHLYALQGYAELFLAELFCSGVPLSTLDYGGDFTYQPGSTTGQIFTHAAALFDSALALAGDSARFANVARVGLGRAMLALAKYPAAAAAVADVSDDYRYHVTYNDLATGSTGSAPNFARFENGVSPWSYTVPDREGFNGLDWRTSDDPRTQLRTRNYVDGFKPKTNYSPVKYDTTGASPVVLASGVEARLIEAEAALQAGDAESWLAKLNALRTDGTFTVDSQAVVDNTVSPPDTSWTYDTLWHAGTGGVAGLGPLTDLGTAGGRVDLLFRERGFWLFLTGHRQGDLRRLLRQYGRAENNAYPVGVYPTGLPYGGDVTAPIPTAELANPLYTGCASRGA